MVPLTKIVKQTTLLTHAPKTGTQPGEYWITLVLKDDDGHDFVFRSKLSYKSDESGKACFDMETVKTADFDYK